MTLYNPIRDAGATPGPVQVDTSSYIFGLYFSVSVNCYINGIWWYCDHANGQYNNNLGDEKIGLWGQITTGNGVYIPAAETAQGTYSQGWNLLAYNSPVALTAGREYCACKGISAVGGGNQLYTARAGFFSNNSPGVGTNGFSDGPVLVYSSAQSGWTGLTNNEPHVNGQQGFYTGTIGAAPPSPMSGHFPGGTFQGGWYGMDVQIATTPAQSGSGLLMASFP